MTPLRPTRLIPATERKTAPTVARLAALVNRGLVVDSQTIVAEQLSDGRIRIDLHPSLKQQLGLEE